MQNRIETDRLRRRKPILAIAAALALAPLALWAAGPAQVEKTIDTTTDPEISMNNMRGQVVVRGWNRSQVRAFCNILSPRVEIETEAMPKTGKAERVHLTARATDASVSGADETADCTLDIPAAASLEIRNRQGAIQIEKVEGQHARVESTDGKITASDVTGHLVARSLGGDIEIIRPSGRVEAYSITGNITFTAPTSKALRGNTNSGRIVYHGDFMPAGEYILSSYSGDIELALPPSASFDLYAKTVNGKVDNTFSLKPKRRSAPSYPSGNSLLGTHSTGNASVELTSFSGRIRVGPLR